MNDQDSLSYRDAGVDIDAGNLLVERIKPAVSKTRRPGVLSGIGGFGGLFELPVANYKEPVLVSGTDGVGTKLKIAIELGLHKTIGIDLVAMCANDIVVLGAEPLFFLDYYATGKLDVETATSVIEGIAKGCEIAGAALLGGETAEMPGMYSEGDYDLAGFCVGIVEKQKIIDGNQVREGDVLIGLASSGPHSNGYSLIRKIIEKTGANIHLPFDDSTLGETLLAPTRIYVKSLLRLIKEVEVKAIAHITGGGLLENIPRVLPKFTEARIESTSWVMPAIFQWLQEKGKVSTMEMHRTFNCGIGMVLCMQPDQASLAQEVLTAMGEKSFIIGKIGSSKESTPKVVML